MNRRGLILTVAVLLASAVAQAGVLFRDDFSGGKSKLWRQVNDGSVAGSFRLEGGAYVLRSPNSVSSLPRALVSSVARDDYFLQADVRIAVVDRSYATASLISYYNSSTNYYEFSVDAQHMYWSLRKVDKAGESLLSRGPVPGAGRSLFRLGLYAREGDLRAFIDGIEVAGEFDRRSLPGGGFGLSARGAEARWDNVVVRAANPQEFFYSVESRLTDSNGNATFNKVRLAAIDSAARALAGIRVYRIRRDGLSYFVFHDATAKFAPRSGFLSEFEPVARDTYRVALGASGTAAQTAHTYDWYQVLWLMDFVRKSARIVARDAVAELNATRNVYLRDNTLQQNSTPLNDQTLGTPGAQAEIHEILYGNWEDFGNYKRFPSFSGGISSGDQLIRRSATVAGVPSNSKFTLHVLRLSAAGGPAVTLAWLVQDDSRAFVLVESAGLPSALQPGGSYTVPFTLLNTGERAGAFQLSVVLSRNSFAGPVDIVMGRRSFDGLAGGGRIQSEMSVQLPSGTPEGRYFTATLLETPGRDKVLRVHNGNFVRPATVGNLPSPGRLTVSLDWSGPADLDLHVTDPMAETVYYFRPKADSGGSLKQDRECGDPAGAEVVDYPNGTAVPGTYAISIHYFRACGSPQDASWTLTVNSDQGTRTYDGTIRPGDYIRATDYVR